MPDPTDSAAFRAALASADLTPPALLEITSEQEQALREIAQATRKTAAPLDDELVEMCVASMRCCLREMSGGVVGYTTNDSRWTFEIQPDGSFQRYPNDLS